MEDSKENIHVDIGAERVKSVVTVPSLLQKAGSSQVQRNSSSSVRTAHSKPSGHSSHSGNFVVRSTQSSGSRSKEVVIIDPYLDAITKETRARNTKRFTVSNTFT